MSPFYTRGENENPGKSTSELHLEVALTIAYPFFGSKGLNISFSPHFRELV